MNVFISYSSDDRAKLTPLLNGLHRLQQAVWFDEDLTGGQQWWDTILQRIRGSDVVLLAVSPAFLESEACSRETDYARSVGRRLVPVMIEKVSPELLPPELAPIQIVDFTRPNGDAAASLLRAFQQLSTPEPVPNPLPSPPPVPISYLSGLSKKILSRSPLPYEEQVDLTVKLRIALGREREREAAIELIAAFKKRDDISLAVSRELDAMQKDVRASQMAETTAPVARFYPDP